jgi:hypothetical protein
MQRTHVLRRAMPPTAGAADSGAARVLHVRDVDRRFKVPDTLIRHSVGIDHRRPSGRSRARAQLSGSARAPFPGVVRHRGRVMRELGSNVEAGKDRSVLTARR